MPEFGDMVQWAVLNAVPAGRARIKKEFGLNFNEARQVARVATERMEEGEPDGGADHLGVMKQNRRLKEELEKYENFERMLARIWNETVPALPAYRRGERELPKKCKMGKNKCTLMLEASDWQVGMEVREHETAGLGVYNFEVFKRRLRYLRDVVLTVYDEQTRVRPIDTLVINMLGDLLEGATIYRGQAWFADLRLEEQFQGLIFETGAFVRDLALRIPNIRIFAIPGNHGRIGRKGELPALSNAEYLMLFALQLYIQQLTGVRMLIGKSSILAYELMGRTHLLAHGDKTKRWNQIPFYGFTRDTLRYISMMRLMFQYAHYGHHHVRAEWEESGVEIIVNGALCGPNELSVGSFKSANTASQRLFVVHPEHGLAWQCAPRFDEPQPPTADEDGVFTPVARPEDVPRLVTTKDTKK